MSSVSGFEGGGRQRTWRKEEEAVDLMTIEAAGDVEEQGIDATY
jgi:hypothetical protein